MGCVNLKKESEAVLLRIFIRESSKYMGKPLYKHLIEVFKEKGLAGATVIRGIEGFGKSGRIQTVSILRMSDDMPLLIEVTDTKEKMDAIKPFLDEAINEGLVTEEKVRIIQYEKNL